MVGWIIGSMRGSLMLAETLLLSATMMTSTHAQTSSAAPHKVREQDSIHTPEVAVTYDLERGKISNTADTSFWLLGGGVEVALPIARGFGIAATLTGQSAANIQPGVNLSKLSYLAGPRFTVSSSRFTVHHVSKVFGNILFGGARAFNSLFPGLGAPASTANAFALQLGGGLDLALANGFSLRALEIDYVRTGLPNNSTNSQDDLHLAFGLSYNWTKPHQ
jgi:hypothetical protein